MSSDGCQEVKWKGQAFSYLLHHPTDQRSHNYGELRQREPSGHNSTRPNQSPSSDVHARAGYGTWNGPAPQGFLDPAQRGKYLAPPKPAATAREHRDVRIGSARVPLIGLNTAGLEDTGAMVAAALDAGVRLIDCAPVNGNEAAVGAALKPFIDAGKRDELIIVSKIWNDAKRPDAVRASVTRSLAVLGCGHLDLLLIHWPVAWAPGTRDADTGAGLAETWAAMEALVDEGLVRQLGVANFSLAQVEGLLEAARLRPVCNFVELHAQLSQRKLVGTLLRKGVQCVAHSPLGGPGNPVVAGSEAARALAAKAGRTAGQMLLKWGVQRGTPVVLDNPGSVEALKEQVSLFGWQLDEFEKVKLDGLNEDRRYVQPEWSHFADPEEGGALKPSAVFGDGKHYA